jgi:hypothetical protein
LDFPHIALHNLHHNALPVAEHAIAGHTEETERLRMEYLFELLNATARGEPMPSRVDLQAGY